jgi:membrane-bound metal-dependent hydrolase YbcI (DUF457 family)
MPAYKTHVAVGCLWGLSAYYILALHYPLTSITFLLICAIAGALFPDIDTKSKGQKIFYVGILCLIFICLKKHQVFYALSISIISFIPILVKHRGLFHNMWFVFLLIALSSYITAHIVPAYTWYIIRGASFFALGVMSHLWLDLGTRRMLRLRR